jgi:hypothetical protein
VEEEYPQDQPQLALDSDEEEEDEPDEHFLSEAETTLHRLVGAIVEKMAVGEETVVWTVVPTVTTNTRNERSSDFREEGVGLKGGIPPSKDINKGIITYHQYPTLPRYWY